MILALALSVPFSIVLMRHIVPCVRGGDLYSGPVPVGQGKVDLNGVACAVSPYQDPMELSTTTVVISWCSICTATMWYSIQDLLVFFMPVRVEDDDLDDMWMLAD
jgi:hypothetical protein